MLKIQNLSFQKVENMRMTPIQKNYRKLQENFSIPNTLKFIKYLTTKESHEILENLNCVMSLPAESAWRLLEQSIASIVEDGYVEEAQGYLDEMKSFKEACVEKGLDQYMEAMDNCISNSSNILKNNKFSYTKESMTKHMMKGMNFYGDSSLYNIVKEHCDAIQDVFFSDDEKTIIEALTIMDDQMTKAEALLSERITPVSTTYPLSRHERSIPVFTKEDSYNARKTLIDKVDIGKLMVLEDTITSTPRDNPNATTFKRDQVEAKMLVAEIEDDFDRVINSADFNAEDYQTMRDKAEALKDIMDKENTKSVNLNKLIEALDTIYENIVYPKTDYTVFIENKNSMDVVIDDLHADYEVPHKFILEYLSPAKVTDEFKDDDFELDGELQETIRVYENLHSRLLYKDLTYENSLKLLYGLDRMQTILEDTGRNSLGAKIARKKVELARDISTSIKKNETKDSHAKTATAKADEIINNLVSSNIQKLIDAPYKEKREEIIKGGFHLKLKGLIRKAIVHTGLFAINPILGVVALLGAAAKDRALDVKVRREILRDLKDELKILDEKLEDAKSEGNKKEKYQLMRLKNKLEGEINRIENHLEKNLPNERNDSSGE